MSKDKASGKACMNFMNVLLIVLGLVVAGLTIYLNKVDNIPPILSSLNFLMGAGYLIGGLLIVFGIVGICASYGGCLLYLYCILITILSIVCIVATIALIVLTVGMKLKESGNSSIVDQVDNITLSFISKEENGESWTNIQNVLKCCGYTGLEETGDSCSADPKGPDCRAFIFDQLETYCLVATVVILVVTVFVLIINCASCARWKSDCQNQ